MATSVRTGGDRPRICLGRPCRQKPRTVTILAFTLLVAAASVLAGLLGALTGLGGGVVIVPLLTLGFGVDIRYAIGASLVSVIATSSGAAAAYVREGYSNVRIGMVLEVATTLGALGGAALATHLPTRVIAVVFGLALLVSAWLSLRPRQDPVGSGVIDPVAARLSLDSSYPAPEGRRAYHVRSVGTGFGLMGLAGALSGLLGIGFGRGQGAGDGPGDAHPFQGLDDHE